MAGKHKKTPENSFYPDLGRAIRLARIAAGKTQTEVADEIDVSFQQLQKYENGTNRIPVEELAALAAYLDVSISHLLSLPERDAELLSLSERFQANGFHTLLEIWAGIKDRRAGAALVALSKTVAEFMD